MYFANSIVRDVDVTSRGYSGYEVYLDGGPYGREPYDVQLRDLTFENLKNLGIYPINAKAGGGGGPTYTCDNIVFKDVSILYDNHYSLNYFALMRVYSHGPVILSNFHFENITGQPTCLLTVYNVRVAYTLRDCTVRNVVLVGDRDFPMFLHARSGDYLVSYFENVDVDGAQLYGGAVFTIMARLH